MGGFLSHPGRRSEGCVQKELLPSDFSVIIPSLNEENHITRALESVYVPGTKGECQPQIIVVDGGSSDKTTAIAESFPQVKVLTVQRGRGVQLNAGATAAKREWLLFLHADCQLPNGYTKLISDATQNKHEESNRVWGCFSSIDTGRRGLMTVIQWAVRMRTTLLACPYGDQGLFVKSSVYHEEGCQFKEWPFLEDLDWVQNMSQRHGKPAIASQPLPASSRRWDHYGVLQTTVLNQAVLMGYALGIPVESLYQFYNSARKLYV